MPKVTVVKHKTPWSVQIPLKEGEHYCHGCHHHIDSCKCMVFEEVEVSQDEYDTMLKQYGPSTIRDTQHG